MTGDALARPDRRLRRCRMSRAAGTVRRRPGRAGPGGSTRRPGRGRVRRPPAPDDGRTAGCSARTPSRPPRTSSAGAGPRCASGPAPGGSAPPSSALAAEWLTRLAGSRVRAGRGAGRRRRCVRTPAAGAGASRRARRHRRPRRPAGGAVTIGGPMIRPSWAWARAAAAAATLAVVVWRLGAGPFRDGVRAVDGTTLAAAAGIGVADHRLLCLAVDDRGPWPRRPPVAARRRRRVLPVDVPQPDAARAASSATSTAASAMGATCATSAAACGPSRGSGRPGSSCRSCSPSSSCSRCRRPCSRGCRWRRRARCDRGRCRAASTGRCQAAAARGWARLRTRRPRRHPRRAARAPGAAGDRARLRAGRARPRGSRS